MINRYDGAMRPIGLAAGAGKDGIPLFRDIVI